jgi:hypothetical protein
MARKKKVEPAAALALETPAVELAPAIEPAITLADITALAALTLETTPETLETTSVPTRRVSGKELKAAQRQERREKRLKERGY